VDFYWQVGQVDRVQGWMLHISVISFQVQELLQVVIPELLSQNVSFKIIQDAYLAHNLLEGGLGYGSLGKAVTIYPNDDLHAVELAKKLIPLTEHFRGPAIPTDHFLAGNIYTRYGAFNPVLVTNNKGELIRHIYDNKGNLIEDLYEIPFRCPDGQAWPFSEIVALKKEEKKKLLNYKYYPLMVLKPDAKGDVIRGIYFKRIWKIRTCLIKQGRKNMFVDEYGRDIQDRLKWQYELYQALHTEIPMPEVFDIFKENDDLYLAMEFVKGKTLTEWLSQLLKHRCWRHLSKSEKLTLLDQLIKVIKIIDRLHKKSYVHRDITPENFLIKKDGSITLIDMELTWCMHTVPQQPTFQEGSPGHTSPEQMRASIPTVKEDVYGIGGLMVMFFTGLYAIKLNGQPKNYLERSLRLYTGDEKISGLIAACWEEQPNARPTIHEIIITLTGCQKIIHSVSEQHFPSPTLDLEDSNLDIHNLVQKGLNHLANPELLNPKKRWISNSMQVDTRIGNQQMTMAMYEGWYVGMAGPLWVVAIAKQLGYSVDICLPPYTKTWQYIEDNYLSVPDKITPGLYSGNAGIALTIHEGLKAGLLKNSTALADQLQRCFLDPAIEVSLATGVAGQGLALLHCSEWLNPIWVDETLMRYVHAIVERQQADGSWNTYHGVDWGTAGILLFLLSYVQRYPTNDAVLSIEKALNQLERAGRKKKGAYSWTIHTQSKTVDKWGVGIGIPGIVISFLKAYEVLKDERYKHIVESCLSELNPYPVLTDFSLASGLAGLGELYLEAFKILQDPIWQERAQWIAAILLYGAKPASYNEAFWLTNINPITTADLFPANGGILHFLMRYYNPEKTKHAYYL